MSWFGSNNNGGQHNISNKTRSGELGHVHRPVIVDHKGVKHPIVGLGYESLNRQQYTARMENVVKYRRFPGVEDEEEYNPSRTEEYGTGDLSGRMGEFTTKETPWDSRFRFNSPPSKDHRNTTRDDDKHHNTKGSRSNYIRDQEDYIEHANPKTNGYSPPKYPVQISTHQDYKEKANDYAPRRRMGPFGSPPRNETSYETSNFKPVAYSPPRFNPQPKKEEGKYNHEIIDSNEARRRYGKGVPEAARPGLTYSGGTIDSKEAAKKYNGVLLTN